MGHPDEPDTTTREESLEVWLDADARAAGEARAIAEDVASRLPAQLRDDVLLVTSELVANAVEHGSGDRVNLRLQVVEPSEDSDSDAGA
ncbi:MAG: ATP-binding protein, partial [Microthrixaceae bacterium]|nr:ATP-binding protein [Microthrixaceae bacterium]